MKNFWNNLGSNTKIIAVVLAGVILFSLGIGAGSGGSSSLQGELDVALTKVDALSSQVETLQAENEEQAEELAAMTQLNDELAQLADEAAEAALVAQNAVTQLATENEALSGELEAAKSAAQAGGGAGGGAGSGSGSAGGGAVQPAATEEAPVIASTGGTVYIASSGNGTKYHSTPTCSNMKNAASVSRDEAVAWGLGACSKCW